MAEQNSFMPAAQTSFLAALPEIKENQVITGFDALAPVQFCTPSFLNCRLCIGANIVSGFVTLTISASTPFGSVSKSFKITNNVTFTWAPFGLFKVEVKVANFRKTGSSFSFTLTVKVCVKVIFVWKCASYSHTFTVPFALSSAQQALYSAPSADADEKEFDPSQGLDYSTLLLLQAFIEEEKGGCNCEKNED